MRAIAVLDRAEEIIASLCLALMVILIGMQVFNRYVLGSSLVWSEELARYLFIWAVYVGCAYATKQRSHLSVTILQNFAPRWLKLPAQLLADFATVVFCGFCVVWGIGMLRFLARTGQEAPAMDFPMYWVYLALPLGMLLMAVRIIERSVLLIKGLERPPEEASGRN